MVLNKALFYLDLAHLRDTGAVFTTTAYIALPLGPVVARYETKLIRPLEKAGIAVQGEDGFARPVRFTASETIETPSATDYIADLASKVANWAGELTSTKVSDFSHENLGWKFARNKHDGRPSSINMTIAMQQVLDADPWLEEDLSFEELASTNSASGAEQGW